MVLNNAELKRKEIEVLDSAKSGLLSEGLVISIGLLFDIYCGQLY